MHLFFTFLKESYNFLISIFLHRVAHLVSHLSTCPFESIALSVKYIYIELCGIVSVLVISVQCIQFNYNYALG
jgi:hypothetical protein